MRVRGIHHVNVNVHSLDDALDFYVNKLGLEPFERPRRKVRGGWLRMGSQELHIVEAPDATIDKKQHFALLVDDVDEAATHLERKGIAFRRIHNDDGRSDQIFIHDPSGNRIEIQGPT
jgi:catechol 2,3-dioxygenase-like lactoylglutathione lyase family enzyme